MENIGLYTQQTNFTTEHAGTAEWCIVLRDGKRYFAKKFHSPVYPSKDIGLPEKMYIASVETFHNTLNKKNELYNRLRECDQSGVLVVPVEVINYQFHICTIAEYVKSNVSPDQIHLLSKWQRLILMRTLTLALMSIHKAGVVHSDLKPDNVLVTQDEKGYCKLRLIDFDGSFFESDPPADPEDVVGDPAFFSPEAYMQSVDEDICLDHRIDIFALGLIFHYFWTGTYPGRPENQTIGESLIRDEIITIDESIPLALQKLILKMIAKDPDDRISLKSVYDVLGVQIGLWPMEIKKIHTNYEEKNKPEKRREEKETAGIRIDFRDEDGRLLKYTTLRVPYGTRDFVTAEEIPGYCADYPVTKEIKVSDDGHAISPITFTYQRIEEAKKPSKVLKVILKLIALFAAYLLIVCLLMIIAKSVGDYKTAKIFMDCFPFYSDIFPDDYVQTVVMGGQLFG